MDELKELQVELRIVCKNIYALDLRKQDLESQITELQSPFALGDIVESRDGKRAQISRFDNLWTYGTQIKKDGTLGKREIYLYRVGQWKKVEP